MCMARALSNVGVESNQLNSSNGNMKELRVNATDDNLTVRDYDHMQIVFAFIDFPRKMD